MKKRNSIYSISDGTTRGNEDPRRRPKHKTKHQINNNNKYKSRITNNYPKRNPCVKILHLLFPFVRRELIFGIINTALSKWF